MKARILDKSEEKKWDEFVMENPLATIHQTSSWGHFQEKIPYRGKYWIVVLENEKGKIIGGSMVIRHLMRNKYSWLYCARGPLFDYNSKNLQVTVNLFLDALKPIAKKEKAVFARIDPPLKLGADNKVKASAEALTLKKVKGFRVSHNGFQPEHTLMLDLTKSEAEILAQMKPKGRYNIKLAEKKGVTVRKSDTNNKKQLKKDLDCYHKILHETTMRDKFYGHKKYFYEHMLKTLTCPDLEPDPNGSHSALYVAEYKNKIIAGMIATFYKDTGTYYYGASSNEHREVMAPYLLQWTAIKESKSLGFKHYDFLGIAPAGAKNHEWQGVTDFKRKFGGIDINYEPPREYAFKKLLYALYRIHKKC